MNQRGWLLLAVMLIAAASVLTILSTLPGDWGIRKKQEPNLPAAAEVLVPKGLGSGGLPRGARREPSGYLTVLAAPATEAAPQPNPPLPKPVNPPPGPPVPPELSAAVRLFARQLAPPVRDDLIPSNLLPPPQQISRVILRDGCFRLAEPGEPHAVFTVGTRLYLDGRGYLAIGAAGPQGPMRARVGELLWWSGERRQLRDPRSLAQIHARCGPGRAEIVGLVQSVSIGQALADGMSATRFASMYGVPWSQAIVRVRLCRERLSRSANGSRITMIETPCGSTPPRPVANPSECPAGTSLSGGLCRTPQGYVRPIPPM